MNRFPRASDRFLSTGVVRWSDRVLDGAVAGLACWTVVFHFARWTGMGRDGALGLWIVAIVAWTVLRLCRPVGQAEWGSATSDPAPDQRWSVAGLAVVALVLVWVDVDGLLWPVLWAVMCILLLAAVRRSLPMTDPTTVGKETARAVPTDAAAVAVLLLAVVMAFLSLVMVRPDQDDVFVVNRSTWIAEHDTSFPERDTIFSDDVLPVQRPAGLPTSLEAFIGSVAALVRVTAATLTYLGLAPLVAALSVLATWRLLRGLGARAPVLATWAGAAFLILDGAEHGSFGNFSAGRSWQGKVVFLMLVVPMLWHHAAALGRTGRRKHLSATVLGVVAGLGLTSTAVLVAPAVVAAATTATAVHATTGRARRARLGCCLVATLPALVVGVGTLLSEPQRLDDLVGALTSGVVAAFDPLRWLDSGTEPIGVIRMVFGDGLGALLAVASALLAWATVGDRSTRLLLLAGPVAVFVGFLAPGVLDVLNEVGEADAIAWRTIWILPIPALVGLMLTQARLVLPGRSPVPSFAVVVAVLLVLALSGTSITSSANRGTRLVWPPAVDLPHPDLDGARGLVDRAPAGGRVAGPEDIDFAVSVLTSRVKSTNPRSAYLRGRHVDGAFRATERRTLSHALEHGWAEWGIDAVADALDGLRPDAVCLRAESPIGDRGEVAKVLVDAGYRPDGTDIVCRYFVRSDPSG